MFKQHPCCLINIDDFKIVPPAKEIMKNSMEAVIHHFKFYSEVLRYLKDSATDV